MYHVQCQTVLQVRVLFQCSQGMLVNSKCFYGNHSRSYSETVFILQRCFTRNDGKYSEIPVIIIPFTRGFCCIAIARFIRKIFLCASFSWYHIIPVILGRQARMGYSHFSRICKFTLWPWNLLALSIVITLIEANFWENSKLYFRAASN